MGLIQRPRVSTESRLLKRADQISWFFLCFPTVYLRFILSVHSSLAPALLILIVIQVKLAKTKQLCLQSDSI